MIKNISFFIVDIFLIFYNDIIDYMIFLIFYNNIIDYMIILIFNNIIESMQSCFPDNASFFYFD